MQLPVFFIKRPVFASILSIMILAVGLVSLKNLSVREYPDVPLPKLNVQTYYPNASAELVESRVTNILEDSLAAVPGLMSMGSESKEGASHITLHFKPGDNVDAKLVAVRDAVEKVRSDLPQDVLSPTILRGGDRDGPPFIAITFSSDRLSAGELTHLVNVRFKNAFRSVDGVASAEIWSPPYAMDINLDPKQLYALGLNISDVCDALEGKKEGFPAGKLHDEVPVTLLTELKTEEDFRNLVIEPKPASSKPILLQQVADVRQTVDESNFRIRVNGKPGTIVAIKLNSDANPLDVSTAVRAQVAQMQSNLPAGMKVSIDIDNADFIRASMSNIQQSLLEAFFLVFAIIFLFMRNLRACLVPLVTIPISLIGVLGVFLLCGISINIITMLAIILAIGLVVDDAIVVLENIQRHIEEGLSPWEASLVGSREIGFAVVAMTLTLASVYAPIGFLQSTMGFLFREFAVALAGAVIISGIVSLSLCPMLCSRILRSNAAPFFPAFDRGMLLVTNGYEQLLRVCFTHKKWVFIFMATAFGASLYLMSHLPEEMAPPEDRGLLGAYAPPVPGKGMDAQESYAKIIDQKMASVDEAAHRIMFIGSWGASVALPLKDWRQRKRSSSEIANGLRGQMTDVPSFDVMVWEVNSGLPGVEVGNSNALNFVLKTNESYKDLHQQGEKLMAALEKTGLFATVKQSLLLSAPSWRVVVDTYHQSLFGVGDAVLSKALTVSLSKDSTISYLKDGISYGVLLKTTMTPDTLSQIYVVNPQGRITSLESLTRFEREARPNSLMHQDQARASVLDLEPKEGVVLGRAIEAAQKVATQILPASYSTSWTGTTREFLQASSGTTLLFGLAIFFIFAI